MVRSKIYYFTLILLQATLEIYSLHGSSPAQLPLTTNNTLQQNTLQRNRLRRKAGIDTSSPVEYMIQLRDSLTDSSGKPRTETEDPTNVWCLLDRDLVDGVQRTKLSNKKCRVTHQLPFNTGALLDMLRGNKVFVQKVILRTYMDTIQRYFKKQGTIPVQFTATFTVPELGTNSSLTIFGGEQVVSVTADSSRWVELNLTSGLTELQSLSSKISSNVELTISISVDCADNKKVPVTLADPATVPLNQSPRRLRLSKFQPMLLVFLSDEDLKTEIKQEAEPPPLGDNLDIQERARRESGGCHLEDFAVNFHNIDLTYVLAPFQYNARKCVGSCSHAILRYQGHLATNHAKIMASAVALKNFDPDTPFRTQPAEPCCVPTKYESISLLILDDRDRLSYAVYPTMRVAGCGCR